MNPLNAQSHLGVNASSKATKHADNSPSNTATTHESNYCRLNLASVWANSLPSEQQPKASRSKKPNHSIPTPYLQSSPVKNQTPSQPHVVANNWRNRSGSTNCFVRGAQGRSKGGRFEKCSLPTPGESPQTPLFAGVRNQDQSATASRNSIDHITTFVGTIRVRPPRLDSAESSHRTAASSNPSTPDNLISRGDEPTSFPTLSEFRRGRVSRPS